MQKVESLKALDPYKDYGLPSHLGLCNHRCFHRVHTIHQGLKVSILTKEMEGHLLLEEHTHRLAHHLPLAEEEKDLLF